jgi:hypothetical protein
VIENHWEKSLWKDVLSWKGISKLISTIGKFQAVGLETNEKEEIDFGERCVAWSVKN